MMTTQVSMTNPDRLRQQTSSKDLTRGIYRCARTGYILIIDPPGGYCHNIGINAEGCTHYAGGVDTVMGCWEKMPEGFEVTVTFKA